MFNSFNSESGQTTLTVQINKLPIQAHLNMQSTVDLIQKVAMPHIIAKALWLMTINGCLFRRIIKYQYGERLIQCCGHHRSQDTSPPRVDGKDSTVR